MFYKKPFILSLLLIIEVFSSNTRVFGQSPEYKNYTVKDGLPSSEIYNSIQDSKGFLWFATDKGVSRFDGYVFTTFNTSNGLADNIIFECQEDFKGRIWFRSFSGKLSYYYNDSIYKLAINDSLSKLIKESFVESISIDTSDNLYLGLTNFNKGIIKIPLKDINSFSVIPVPPEIYYIILPSGGKPLTGGTRSRLLEFTLD
jgi:ligand-binding sensor domain-containing protein